MKYINRRERERIDKSIKTQVNRHIHTKHTGKQLLYSHKTHTETGTAHNSCSNNQVLHINAALKTLLPHPN